MLYLFQYLIKTLVNSKIMLIDQVMSNDMSLTRDSVSLVPNKNSNPCGEVLLSYMDTHDGCVIISIG